MSNRILLLFMVCVVPCCGQNCESLNDPYEPVAEFANFPVDPNLLTQWLGFDAFEPESKPFGVMNIHALRRHAWTVFSGMTAPSKVHWPDGGQPLARWETWYEADQDVFNCRPTRDLLSPSFQPPRQLPTPSPERPLPITARILFNRTAREYIRGNKLYEAKTLDGLLAALPSSGQPQHEAIDFPRAAIAVKTAWMLVRGTGCTPIPVWDSERSVLHEPVNAPKNWPRSVGVVATEGDDTPCKDIPQRIPISRFHSIKLDASISAPKDLDPRAHAGDYLILVGLHFTTKEIPNWVWGTVWWHDRPNDGRFAEDRPESVRGVWRNYLMDTAYDMDRPMERDATPKIAFNPYLEAGLFDGVSANCMSCHRRATWRIPKSGRITLSSFGQSLDLRQIVVRGSEAATATYFPEYTHLLKLDFLWSLMRAH